MPSIDPRTPRQPPPARYERDFGGDRHAGLLFRVLRRGGAPGPAGRRAAVRARAGLVRGVRRPGGRAHRGRPRAPLRGARAAPGGPAAPSHDERRGNDGTWLLRHRAFASLGPRGPRRSRAPRREPFVRAFRGRLRSGHARGARARAPASDDVGLIAPRASLFPNEEALSETAAERSRVALLKNIERARVALRPTPRGGRDAAGLALARDTAGLVPDAALDTPERVKNSRGARRGLEPARARRRVARVRAEPRAARRRAGVALLVAALVARRRRGGRPSPSPSPSRRSIDPGGERARAPQPYAPQHVRVRKRKRVRSGSPRQLAGPGRLERRVARRNSRVGNVRRRRVFFRLKRRARVRRDGARVPDGLRARVSRGLLPGRAGLRI